MQNQTRTLFSFYGLAFLAIMFILFLGLGSVVGMLVSAGIHHLGWRQVLDVIRNPDGTALSINVLRWFLLISSIVSYFIPAFLFTMVSRQSVVKMGGFNVKINFKLILLVFVIFLCAIPAISLLEQVMQSIPWSQGIRRTAMELEASREKTFNTVLDMQAPYEIFVCLLIVALTPAFIEEFLFRGVVQKICLGIVKNNIGPAIFLQAVLFGLLHATLFQAPSIILMGAVLGIFAYYSGSLWYGILFHFLINASTVITKYFANQFFQKNGYYPEYNDAQFPWYIGLLGLVGLVYFCYQFIKKASAYTHNRSAI